MQTKALCVSVVSVLALLACAAYAQDLDHPSDKFSDFEAKLHVLGPRGALPLGKPGPSSAAAQPQTPEELQAMMEQESLDQQRKIEEQRLEMIRRIRTGGMASRAGAEDPFKGRTVVDGTVTDVTVYSDHAKVTRTVEVDVVKGPQVLVFKNMPDRLMMETVRAEGASRGTTVRIGAIQSKNIEVPFDTEAGDKPALENLNKLETEARKLLAEKQAAELQKAFFENLSASALKGQGTKDDAKDGQRAAAPEIAPEKWLKSSTAYRDGMAQILGALAAQDARLDEIGRDLGTTESGLLRKYYAKGRASVVYVPVEASAAGKLELKLVYQVSNVSWKPSYDVQLSSDKGAVEIVQYANVAQGSGEDWDNVALTLSTSQPQKNGELPEPKPFWIDVTPPQPVVIGDATPRSTAVDPLAEWRQKTEAKRVQMENEQAPEEREQEQPEVVPLVQPIHPQPAMRMVEEPVPVVVPSSTIVTGGAVSQYAIPGHTTVTKDGGETKVLIGSFDAEAKLQALIRPRHAAEAQLMVHFTLKGRDPILAGQANMFRDGVYTGQVELPVMEPGAEHNISLGMDEQIVVKRRKLRDEQQEHGLISKDNLVAREYVTEIQNLHTGPVEVIVQEATPTPKDEKVAVDLRPDFTTPGYVKDDDNVKGLLTWDFTMQPKDKKTVNLGWTINWPLHYTLLGI
jgi:hypothetical protein